MGIAEFKEKIQDLPTLPAVASQINIESQKDTFTAKSLGEIISKDPPLSAKVMKLANSAYYGLAREVTTIDRGVTLLGLNTIRNLALTVSIFKYFSQGNSEDIDLKGFWNHSLGCAVAAKALAGVAHAQMEEEAFLCGIIHDIGQFAMITVLPDEMKEALKLANETDLAQIEAEKRILGFNHQEAGAALAESWNFPEKHFRGIRFHHNPFLKSIDPADPDSSLVYLVYVGNEMAKAMKLGKSINPKADGIKPAIWKLLDVTPRDLPTLRIQIKKDFENAMHTWDLDEG